jgi:uncharacterized membrane protein YcaP (DUF421 family)
VDIVIRAAVIFVFVYLPTRLLGRRELSTMEPFDLILPAISTIGLLREEIGAEARLEGIASIEDVRWAILETNGRISLVEKTA